MADDSRLGPALVTARGLGVRLGGHDVLTRVDLAVRPGEIVTVVGPNGSGKTTLVRALLGLVAPDAGKVARRPGLAIGYVPQHVTVDRTLPLDVRRFLGLAPRSRAAKVDAALAETGAAAFAARPFQALSGGEQKRVLLARALLADPGLLALDEPTASVDIPGQVAFYRLIREIRDRRGCGILLVSHDLHLVMAQTDRVVCLNRHVCCSGTPEAVSRHPEYRALFGLDAMSERDVAVYAHGHDHTHDLGGEPLPAEDDARPSAHGHHHG
jgi:zinc transport system ATP-binding protein